MPTQQGIALPVELAAKRLLDSFRLLSRVERIVVLVELGHESVNVSTDPGIVTGQVVSESFFNTLRSLPDVNAGLARIVPSTLTTRTISNIRCQFDDIDAEAPSCCPESFLEDPSLLVPVS